MPSIPGLNAIIVTFLCSLTVLPGAVREAAADQPHLADMTEIRADDARRLQELDASTGAALRQAFAGGAPEDVAELTRALAGDPLSPEDALAALPGEWSCRTIKLGKNLPLVVYQEFRCLVSENGEFEKLTGSQRTRGELHLDGERLVYLGTGFVSGETPVPYADLPEQVDTQTTPQLMPEIGVVEMTSSDHARILFPDPYLESRMDLILLRR
ncbi:DUF4893 domain-containing protein [Paracoccus onubensis]|uniref:DUF4893 domain-containing protein n=1 Tax=Paracoccus onubensis TaxID=1675788 RepID=UPI002730BAEB|nr:DUF4893 domain-containing protein [Paracoccus onubensis]MDP0927528.1 DUF4893 domain-containing protein [Paracoccus onubensis]